MDLLPGDRLVLATDGAAKADPEDDGQRCWAFMDELADVVAHDPYPVLIASLLCRRADELGGYDNATVLVIAMTSADDPRARHLAVSSWVRRMETGLA
jgi:serine/threonine protein phosphatase PrpC